MQSPPSPSQSCGSSKQSRINMTRFLWRGTPPVYSRWWLSNCKRNKFVCRLLLSFPLLSWEDMSFIPFYFILRHLQVIWCAFSNSKISFVGADLCPWLAFFVRWQMSKAGKKYSPKGFFSKGKKKFKNENAGNVFTSNTYKTIISPYIIFTLNQTSAAKLLREILVNRAFLIRTCIAKFHRRFALHHRQSSPAPRDLWPQWRPLASFWY